MKLIRTAAVVVLSATLLPASPALAAPTCFGEPATIVGTSGDDELEGTKTRDVIVGLGGTDEIHGRGGDDLICGGDNPKRFYPDDDDEPIPERLWGGPGADRVTGEGGFDYIIGGGGRDVLFGGPGEDMLTGSRGNDRSFGGAGNDRILSWVKNGSDSDYASGGSGDDLVSDDRGADVLKGGNGDDHLLGGIDNDTLKGGRGADRLVGAGANDLLHGGRDTDLVDYIFEYEGSSSMGSRRDMRVDLAAGRARGYGRDTLAGLEGVLSGSGTDVLMGDSGPNLFFVGTSYFRTKRTTGWTGALAVTRSRSIPDMREDAAIRFTRICREAAQAGSIATHPTRTFACSLSKTSSDPGDRTP